MAGSTTRLRLPNFTFRRRWYLLSRALPGSLALSFWPNFQRGVARSSNWTGVQTDTGSLPDAGAGEDANAPPSVRGPL